jgi:hypothetical protein
VQEQLGDQQLRFTDAQRRRLAAEGSILRPPLIAEAWARARVRVNASESAPWLDTEFHARKARCGRADPQAM